MGVATISAQVQRSGGTQQLPGAELDEALERRAASIEGGAAGESVTFGEPLCTLQEDDLSVDSCEFIVNWKPPHRSWWLGKPILV